jgi:hypothetical protein
MLLSPNFIALSSATRTGDFLRSGAGRCFSSVGICDNVGGKRLAVAVTKSPNDPAIFILLVGMFYDGGCNGLIFFDFMSSL